MKIFHAHRGNRIAPNNAPLKKRLRVAANEFCELLFYWWRDQRWMAKISYIAMSAVCCVGGAVLTFSVFDERCMGNIVEVLLRMSGLICLTIGAGIGATAIWYSGAMLGILYNPDHPESKIP